MPSIKTELFPTMARRKTDPILRLLRIGRAFSFGWCLLAAGIILVAAGPFEAMDHQVYDLKLGLRAHFSDVASATDIVHLDVDDQAIHAFGPWPWDRSQSAAIVRRLKEFQARAVLLDVIYSSEGKTAEGDQAFFEAIREAGNVVAAFGAGLSASPRPKAEWAIHTTRSGAPDRGSLRSKA